MDENIYRSKIEKLMEDKEFGINLVMSLLGQSGTLLDFIMNKHEVENLPLRVKYSGLITANMLQSLTCGTEFPRVSDKSNDYNMSEQTEERINRIMNEILDEYVEWRDKNNGK